ncbi:MAG: hypothetical protein AB1813_19005, partial [Verrucomicrobiota bacterium]
MDWTDGQFGITSDHCDSGIFQRRRGRGERKMSRFCRLPVDPIAYLIGLAILTLSTGYGQWWDQRFGSPGVSGSYVASILKRGGDLYLGGSFLSAGGVESPCIIHWNGSSWSRVGMKFNGSVETLIASDDLIIAGGSFTQIGATTVDRLAAWNGTTWTPFGSGIAGGVVHAIAGQKENLFVAGEFTTAGGTECANIAHWNGREWQPLGRGLSGPVRCLELVNDRLFAAGNFRTAGTTTANSIAVWDGSSWSALGTGIAGSVSSIKAYAGEIFVGGAFSAAGEIPASNVAKWDGQQWNALGEGTDGPVYALGFKGRELIVGGNFGLAGGVAIRSLAVWDGVSWSTLAKEIQPARIRPEIRAIATDVETIHVGGTFAQIGDVVANHVASISDGQWSTLGGMGGYPWGPLVCFSNEVYSAYFKWNGSRVGKWDYLDQILDLVVTNDVLYAGGRFSTTPLRGAAYWDEGEWNSLGGGIQVSSTFGSQKVSALAWFNGELYAGGFFQSASG